MLPPKPGVDMRRREFITLLGGAAAMPPAARAQQPERIRRIGVLANTAANNPVGQARIAAFQQELQQLGWIDGRNVRIDYRWPGGNADNTRKYAAELVALAPDVILASGTSTVTALQRETRTVPIVFTIVADSVGAGFVDGLARPGGNITGFMNFEFGIGGNGLICSKRSLRSRRGRRSSGIRPYPQGSAYSAPSRLRRLRSGWKLVRSMCATLVRSNVPSRPLRAPAMAA
jgi:hypothetical protein